MSDKIVVDAGHSPQINLAISEGVGWPAHLAVIVSGPLSGHPNNLDPSKTYDLTIKYTHKTSSYEFDVQVTPASNGSLEDLELVSDITSALPLPGDVLVNIIDPDTSAPATLNDGMPATISGRLKQV